MRRNAILPLLQQRGSEEETPITEHLVKTIMDQGHLCPIPQAVRPVHWEYDNALRIYPLPDVVILADHYNQYDSCYEDTIAFNPGSFPADFSFVVYRPATRVTEFSRID
jgi:DNA polymerase epsilon subunit 2